MPSVQHTMLLLWCCWCACNVSPERQDLPKLSFRLLGDSYLPWILRSIKMVIPTPDIIRVTARKLFPCHRLSRQIENGQPNNALNKMQLVPLPWPMSMASASTPLKTDVSTPQTSAIMRFSLEIDGVRGSSPALGGGPCDDTTVCN